MSKNGPVVAEILQFQVSRFFEGVNGYKPDMPRHGFGVE
jgi:hypothetical protein